MNYKILEDKIKQENEDFEEFRKKILEGNKILLNNYELIIKNRKLSGLGEDPNLTEKYNALYNEIYGGLK